MNRSHNPVGWFEIYVQDVARAKAFYESTFQLVLNRLDGPGPELWVFPARPEQPGAAGALAKIAGKGSGGEGTLVYFSCADCAEVAARAAQHGGRIHQAKSSIGQYGFIALVLDTEDNLIGLHSLH